MLTLPSPNLSEHGNEDDILGGMGTSRGGHLENICDWIEAKMGKRKETATEEDLRGKWLVKRIYMKLIGVKSLL